MTSQSARGSRNTDSNDSHDGIVVVSSSSEDDSILGTFSFDQGSFADRRSIRELVREGKRLLTLAEFKSQPEEHRNDAATIYRYNFSSAVTGCDLFRDRELAELVDIVTTLKMRLSAERVFSLGCPQLRSERDVFDELLMRFSDELLDIRQGTHSIAGTASTNVNIEPAPDNVNTEFVNVNTEAESVGSSSNVNRLSDINTPEIAGTPHSLNNLVFHVQDNQSERTVIEPQSRLGSRENVLENMSTLGSTSFAQLNDGEFLKDINISALQDFFKIVNELNSLTSLAHKIPDKPCDPIPYRIIQALHSSLSSIMKTGTTDSSRLALASPRQGKRRLSEESNSDSAKKSKTKTESSKLDDEDKEEDSCSICLEPWSTGGDHRVTCLKCGHLFGLSCILKWVEQAHCCPQCKTSAKKSDLRHIFVPKVTAEDTSQRDRAMRLLEEERLARRNIEQREAMARNKLEKQEADIEALKTEVIQLKAQLPQNGRCVQSQVAVVPRAASSMSSSKSTGNKRFQLFQRVAISPDGNCRVFDQCMQRGFVVASQKSSNSLFRGYGIKILTRDFRPLSYQPLHSAAIRDMSFRPGSFDGMLLSCGLDKCLQLTSVTSQVVVQKYTVSSSVWCCAWNTLNTNLFYAGMERGMVKEFDIRRTDSHVQDVLDYGGSPISSIQYFSGPVDGSSLHGLLVAHLQSLIFGEQANDQFTTHRFSQLQAPLMSFNLHTSGTYMSSFRPSSQFAKCRYEICNLCQSNVEDMPRSVSSRCQAVWEGSNMQPVISRNSLITRPESENDLLAVTANHSNNTVSVWDVSKKQDLQTLPSFDKAIDIKSLSDGLLGVLTDKELLLYNWRS